MLQNILSRKHLLVFLLFILPVSFFFAILDIGLDRVTTGLVFRNILAIYTCALPLLVVEQYIQKPTASVNKTYFKISLLVCMFIMLVLVILLVFFDGDGYGIFVLMLAPFYVIPSVFAYVAVRMWLLRRYSITTEKILHFKYYFLGAVYAFFIVAFISYGSLLYVIEIVLSPLKFLDNIYEIFINFMMSLIFSVFPL